MKILLDTHALKVNKKGVSRYWKELSSELKKIKGVLVNCYTGHKNAFYRTFAGIPLLAGEIKPDIIHGDTFMPLFSSIPTVITLHDLCFLKNSRMLPFQRRFSWELLSKLSLYQAGAIICFSLATKKTLLENYPKVNKEKVFTIPHASSKNFFPLENKNSLPALLKKRFNIDSNYSLVVGDWPDYKKIFLKF